MSTIGDKLKELRQAKSLTLQQVAKGAGCTAAYISQIEHDKASPSIATLKRIAHVLGVRIVDFFMDEVMEDPVVLEPGQWPTVSLPRWRAKIRQMVRNTSKKQMQPFFTIIEKGGGTQEDYSHTGEEFGLVLEGELTLIIGNETHKVQAGASFYYPSILPHAWTNEKDEPCKVIWVVTPPSW